MKWLAVASAAFSLLSFTSNLAAQTPAPKPVAPKTLAERVDTVDVSLDLLIDRVNEMEARALTSVDLHCETGTFAPIVVQGGSLSLLARCAKIEPYLEGYRLTLSIGNPYAMQFDSVSGSIMYGEDRFAASPWSSARNKVPFTTVEQLRPGIWNQIEVVIPRVSAKDMRVIRLAEIAFTSAVGVQR